MSADANLPWKAFDDVAFDEFYERALGVVLERWESTVGLFADPDNIVYRPGRSLNQRSEPADNDLVLYTPRKFARLAVSGNPSVLMMLFGPLRFSTPLGDRLRDLAPAFWSGRARPRFLGYSRAQRERLLGMRGGAHTNRPELVAEFGYDTKYAMHMVRLGVQGIEYASTGGSPCRSQSPAARACATCGSASTHAIT